MDRVNAGESNVVAAPRGRAGGRRGGGLAALCLTLLLATSGCGLLSPQTGELRQVHDAYRTEFAELFLNKPTAEAACLADRAISGTQPKFAQTRAAMRRFRLQYPDAKIENAHLDVLDGMMHLQVGNYGLARLQSVAASKAEGNLKSGTGIPSRDYLFAQFYTSLVSGWEVVCRLAAKGTVSGATTSLGTAAETIRKSLQEYVDKKALADPDTDQGAVYLATTAAIFEHWGVVKTRDACISGNCECPVSAGPGCTPPVESDITAACVGRTGVDNAKCRTEFYNTFVTKFLEPEFARKYVRFRDLIGGFLDPSERDLALCMDRPDVAPALATASPRFRYIAWFRDLNDKVAATQKLPCPLSLPLLAAPATAPAT